MINIFKNLTIYKWGKSGADIVSKNTSKGNRIKIILDKYGYDFNNTYAIGDGLNDIEMFKQVKHSIAMGNASDEIKRNAKFVTTDIDDRGVEQVLEDIINGKM